VLNLGSFGNLSGQGTNVLSCKETAKEEGLPVKKISKADIANLQKRAKIGVVFGYLAIPLLVIGVVVTNVFGSLLAVLGLLSAVGALVFGISVRRRVKGTTSKSEEIERIRSSATQSLWFGGGLLIALGALALLGLILSVSAVPI
jgi:uncharacterized membrane protein